MTGTVEQARCKLGAASVNKLSRKGCKVKLTGVPKSRLIIDLDSRKLDLRGHQSRCDYLVVIDQHQSQDILLPIELKHGEFDTNTIVKPPAIKSSFEVPAIRFVALGAEPH